MKIIYSVFLAIAIFTLPMTASALTFKKGQILGPDGKVYDGASPQLPHVWLPKRRPAENPPVWPPASSLSW